MLLDGELLNQEDYLYDNGSLLVFLHASCLNSLSVGEHVLTVCFPDGIVKADFYVKERPKPSTPEYIIPKTGR